MNRKNHQYWIYILTNTLNSVLYIGVTNDLVRRVFEHREKLAPGFTAQYSLTKLVFYEEVSDSMVAIGREKQLKGWRREKKVKIIESMNPDWKDLMEELGGDF